MKNLHLLISAILIFLISLGYGIRPDVVLPVFFDFTAGTIDIKEVFRATMGLYAGFACLWMLGVFKDRYWEVATIANFVFMAGLASGRLISFLTDGIPSVTFIIGFIVEVMLALWGAFNLKKYGNL